MAAKDENIVDNVVLDDNHLSYLQRYLAVTSKAISEGVNLKGFFVWSLMDNFEWIDGYSKRFGLIMKHKKEYRKKTVIDIEM